VTHPLLLLLLLLLLLQNLMYGDSQLTAQGFICDVYGCCNPCAPKVNGTEVQEPECTPFMKGPELVFKPAEGSCPTPLPPINVGGEVRAQRQQIALPLNPIYRLQIGTCKLALLWELAT
jgi:hypothetical protein